MKKVIVGMSGGVDSAVTAYLLKAMGYEVIGVTLRTWLTADGRESRCCEIDDAQEVARQLEMPYYAVNCLSDFRREIVMPFVEGYLQGVTPNPCVICNRRIKWEGLLHAAQVMGADYVATGHYASVVRLPNGRYTVQKARSAQKDQTYMLWQLTQEQLSRTLMPLGQLTKDEVRSIAERVGLAVAQKPDSQEICFVTDGSYVDFIEASAEEYVPQPGYFVDEEGHILGTHKGIIHYTVGQRKGLGIALGVPAYVKEINAAANEVVLSSEEALYRTELDCRDLRFLSIPDPAPGERVRAKIKIRYHDGGTVGTVERTGDDTAHVVFEMPVRAPAPGQSAVFYDEADRVIGGGVIAVSS